MELKFRAYDTERKVMLFADIYEMQDIQSEWTKWDKPVDSPENTGTPFDIMLFTGLKDSKGEYIYFDDVVYIAGYGNLHVESLGDLVILVDALAENDIGEILGNIHENENLIEANK